MHRRLLLKNQILVLFLLAVILPIGCLGAFSIVQVRSQMLRHYEEQAHADCVRISSILFDTTTSLFTSLDSIIASHGYMSLLGSECLTDEENTRYEILNDSLDSIYQNYASISSVKIYTDNPHIKTGPHFACVSDYPDQEWYRRMPENSWQSWILLPSEDLRGNPVHELCLIRRMGIISNRYSAYIVLCVDNNYLRNRIEQSDYYCLAALEDRTVFYSSDFEFISTQIPMPDDFDGDYYSYTGPYSINGRDMLADICTLQTYKTGDKFYIMTNDQQAYGAVKSMCLLYLGIILTASVVPSIILFVFTHYFAGRVQTLRLAMHQASLGNYNIVDTFRGDDELTDTFTDLKKTITQVQEKEALYYESRIHEQLLINRQQQMEFNMLASQINPHFLYNTLETIRAQALSYHCREVASSINLLGRSMHYVLENTGTGTTVLSKELDYIRTYLAIQKLRFGERINAIYDIPEEYDLDSIEILPLLLQPVVENAIRHGLSDLYEEGHITISVRLTEPYLLITIEDDGIGMDEQTLDTVRDNLVNHPGEDARSIGLYNINQRIRLFYGSDCHMTIESEKDKGTKVTLKLYSRRKGQDTL